MRELAERVLNVVTPEEVRSLIRAAVPDPTMIRND